MADCADGLYCSCSAATCAPGKTGTCHQAGALKADEACAHDRSCDSGICNEAAGWICRPAGEAAAPCVAHDECGAGLICHKAKKECRPALPKGSDCTERWECADGMVCMLKGSKNICGMAYGSHGFQCTQSARRLREACGGKLVCNQGKGTCDFPADEGGVCGGIGSCKDGLVCNTGTVPGKCAKAASRDVGEPCSGKLADEEKDCKAGLICVNKKCSPPGSLTKGEVCRANVECGAPYKCTVLE